MSGDLDDSIEFGPGPSVPYAPPAGPESGSTNGRVSLDDFNTIPAPDYDIVDSAALSSIIEEGYADRREGRNRNPYSKPDMPSAYAAWEWGYKHGPRALAQTQTGSDAPGQSETLALEVRTARDVCATPDPDGSDELCGPILQRRKRTIIAAATGEGKTTLTAHLEASVVHERDFLGWTGAGGRALIIDLEQDESDAKRVLREAGLADSDDVDYILVPEGLELDRREHERAAVEAVLARDPGYAVVVIDPHYKAQTGDDETPDNSPLMRLLDRWRAEYGFALILPMHLRKPPPGLKVKPTVNDIAGYGPRVRGAEIILLLELLNEGYSRLTFGKIRGIGPTRETWGLLYDREQGYRRDPNDGVTRDYRTELLALAADCEWRTLKQWKDTKDRGGLGASEEILRPLLTALVAEGQLEFAVGPAGRQPTAKCWRGVPRGANGTHGTGSLFGDSDGEGATVPRPVSTGRAPGGTPPAPAASLPGATEAHGTEDAT